MPLACPACGTINPDGGRFCGNCAAPLQPVSPGGIVPPPAAATPPVVAPSPVATPPVASPVAPPFVATPPVAPPPTQPWIAPAGPPPPGWGQAPTGPQTGAAPTGYPAYQPTATPAKRMPVGLIVGGVALVLVILVVGGVAASSALAKPAPSQGLPIVSTPAPSVAVVSPSVSPVASVGPVVTAPPVASVGPVVTAPPVVTPPPVVITTPAPQPTPAPTTAPGPGGGELVSVANLSVMVSGPWTVADRQDYSIQLVIPQKGAMAFTSGTLKDPVTAEAWIQSTLADNQKTDPNASYCSSTPAPESVTVPNGPPGLIAAMCYTATPQGGQAMKLVEIQMVGVDQAGTTVCVIDILAAEENIGEVLDAANPLLSTVTWTLFKG